MGYERISNELINKYFMSGSIKEFDCKAGDLIIENTRGLHKGKPLQEGNRLIFQIEFYFY